MEDFSTVSRWGKRKEISQNDGAPSILGVNALLTSYNEGASVPECGIGSLKLKEQEGKLSTPLFFKLHWFFRNTK